MPIPKSLEAISSRQHPTPELRALPLENHFLPVQSPPLITSELWQKLFAVDGQESIQERADALSFYALFALLGLVGSDRNHQTESDTLVMPVVFDDEKFSVRLTVHRRPGAMPVLTFSLPDESIPVLAPVHQ